MQFRDDFTIDRLMAWEVLDSRGRPTVAVEVGLTCGAQGSAAVPSGTSKGRYEAVELRDGGSRYGGLGVRRAVHNANTTLFQAIRGLDGRDQESVDFALSAADGTADYRRLGANAVLAVSIATLLASAAASGKAVWQLMGPRHASLPMPMVNVISGGRHADLSLDIQDFLIVPVGAKSFTEATEWCCRVRDCVARAASERGYTKKLVADEGRLVTPGLTNKGGLDLLVEGIETANLRPGHEVSIALDIAASHLHANGLYKLHSEGRSLSAAGLTAEVAAWATDYPIVAVEDVLVDDDWAGWSDASKRLHAVQVIGDDLFASNCKRLQTGVEAKCANAVLVKPNQCGTVSAASKFVDLARKNSYSVITSDRSGETDDTWLADLSVLWSADQIKLGSTMRSERTGKWNRLLQIEAQLGSNATFNTWNHRESEAV